MRRAVLDELGAVPEQAAPYTHFFIRPEGGVQPPERMELWPPLGIVVVGLAARHDLKVAGVA